ncbi:MAG: hypothetical protein Q9174_001026 [Haloplaca sp. 1 TL-2023]
MTKLLFLAVWFSTVLATNHAMNGDQMAGGGEMGGYSMGGGEEKNAMEMKPGYGGAEMKGDKQQKTAEAKPAEAGAPAADKPVVVISKCKGGDAPKEQVAEPAMAPAATHSVMVGGDAGLVFTPNTLNAAAGDMVEFTFMAANHTLTQSTFPSPCKKMDGGVDSGFMPNANNTVSPPPTYMFQVMDTKPTWWYCKQKKPTSHCGKGMTFSINPTPEKSQEMFMQKAIEQNGTADAGAAPPAMEPPAAAPPADAPPADAGAAPPAYMPPADAGAAPPADMPPADAAGAPPYNMPPADAAAAPPADMPPADAAAAPPTEMPPADAGAAPPADMPPADAGAAPPADMPPADAATPPPADMPAADAGAAPPAAAPAAAPPAQNLAAAGANMPAGAGTMVNGQCACSCLCNVGAFPAGAGIGMYGGWSGAVPMSG